MLVLEFNNNNGYNYIFKLRTTRVRAWLSGNESYAMKDLPIRTWSSGKGEYR